MTINATPPLRESHLASPAPQTRAQIEKSAQDFTAVALGEMLSPMFDTMQTDGGSFGGGQGEAAWRPMFVQEIAKSLAGNGGLGITDIVSQAMLKMQEERS
jgi:Rod binding domain-containing protein